MGGGLSILRATYHDGHPAGVAIDPAAAIEKINWTGIVGMIIFTPSQLRDV